MEPYTITIWIIQSPLVYAVLAIVGLVILAKLVIAVLGGILKLI